MNPDFHATLVAAPPEGLLEAVIFVREPFVDPPMLRPGADVDLSDEEIDNAILANDTQRKQAVTDAVAPVVDQLTAMGFLTELDELVPAIYTVLPADMLLYDQAGLGLAHRAVGGQSPDLRDAPGARAPSRWAASGGVTPAPRRRTWTRLIRSADHSDRSTGNRHGARSGHRPGSPWPRISSGGAA